MHIISHLLTSFLIADILLFKYNVGPVEFLLAALSGTALDLDHVYNYVKYYGVPKSVMELIRKMWDAYKQPPDSSIRYHTAAHELVGVFVFLVVSILIAYFYSLLYALLIFLPILSHFLLDALSIKMMFLSPFSQKETYFGVLKPNSIQEIVFASALIMIIAAITILRILGL